MSRLIAFGCSYTYGHSLPDCHVDPDRPGPVASNLAWPALLANSLKLECVNRAWPGNSNKKIWHDIMTFDFAEDDIIFVMWTKVDRYCVLQKELEVQTIGPWIEDTNYFRNFYSEYDSVMQSKLYISHCNHVIKNKIHNLVIESDLDNLFESFGEKIEHIPVYFNYFNQFFSRALDGKHPGTESHAAAANRIKKFI